MTNKPQNLHHDQSQTFKARYLTRVNPNAQKEDFVFGGIIGNGSMGNIYRAIHSRDMQQYAVKVFDKEHLVKTKQIQAAYKQKQVLMNLSFEFVINCIYYFADKSNIYLATPYLSGGDLYNYIMWSGQLPNEETAKFYATQIILALEYLHKLQIIHRDLKPENLAIDERGYLKLIDLGSCSVLRDINFTICGTRQYMAPEMMTGKGYNNSVDYWSLGVVIYELSSFELPFDDENESNLLQIITTGKFEIKNRFSPSLKDLVTKLLDVNPQTRYGCTEEGTLALKRHPWFSNVDFAQIYHKTVTPPNIVARKENRFGVGGRELIESSTDRYSVDFDDF